MKIFNNPDRIPLDYGLRIAVGVTAYFVLMKVVGLAHIVELRLLNLLILAAGVYLAIKKLKTAKPELFTYFSAMTTGVATAAIGSCTFAAFLFLYMKLDSSMMQAIVEKEPMGRYLNAYMVSFIVALEGVFSGLLVTFVLINFLETGKAVAQQK